MSLKDIDRNKPLITSEDRAEIEKVKEEIRLGRLRDKEKSK